jgi:F0F1-type ATP synthase epsilon subunit
MLRAASRAFTSSAVSRATAAPAATSALSELTLSLALPHRSLVAKKEVLRVTVPGRDGSLGIEKNSPPLLTELKAGVIRVDYKDNSSEEFFVPGGFAFKHANNVMDVSAPEGVKLENIDVDALRAAATEAGKDLAAAAPGSKAAAEARLALDMYKVLGQAVKVTV